MTLLADLWPVLVLAAVGFCVFALIRLVRRISPGAVSAGPQTPPGSLISDKTDTAETLRTIEHRLDTRPGAMIQRIEQSCVELGVPTDGIDASATPEHRMDQLLQRLESHLDLTILATMVPAPDRTPGPSPDPTGDRT